MAIRHRFQSPKADGSDADRVRPSDWNSDHDHPPFAVPVAGPTTWTNMPAADAEMTGQPRTAYDLTHAAQARVVVSVGVAAVNGAAVRLQYSADEAAWADLTPAAGGLNVVGCHASAWGAVPAGARGEVFVRVVGSGGNGTADPQFRSVTLQVR